MKTLMISTVGGRVGGAILDSLQSARHRLRIVGINSRADAAAVFRCDTAYLVPDTASFDSWAESVRRILAAEKPDLIVPARDGDLEPLARLRTERDWAGTRFYAPGPVSAAIVVDKGASAAFARTHGLPFVDTAVDRAELESLIADHGFPIIAKPRRGTGAKGIFILRQHSEAAACLEAGGYVFQPYLDRPDGLDRILPSRSMGAPMIFAMPRRVYFSVVAAIAPDEPVEYLGATEIEYEGLHSARVRRADDAELAAVARAFGEAFATLDYDGILNMQCQRDRSGRICVFEVNGRPVGGIATRASFGMGETVAILNALFGTAMKAWPSPGPAEAMLDLGFGFNPVPIAAAAELNRQGVWRPVPA